MRASSVVSRAAVARDAAEVGALHGAKGLVVGRRRNACRHVRWSLQLLLRLLWGYRCGTTGQLLAFWAVQEANA